MNLSLLSGKTEELNGAGVKEDVYPMSAVIIIESHSP